MRSWRRQDHQRRGTYTALTASTTAFPMQAAVARAAKHPVRLAELQTAPAIIWRGSFMRSDGRVGRRPQADARHGCLHERCDRRRYTISHRCCRPKDGGHRRRRIATTTIMRAQLRARFVEVDTASMGQAASRTPVMTNYFNAAEAADWARRLDSRHRHNVPCFNDGQRTSRRFQSVEPPAWVSTWWPSRAAKGCGGRRMPVCCSAARDLIAAAAQNSSPRSDTVGRGMKVAKGQIVGMVAAVDCSSPRRTREWKPIPARRTNRRAAEESATTGGEDRDSRTSPPTCCNLRRCARPSARDPPLDVAAEFTAREHRIAPGHGAQAGRRTSHG